MPTFPPCSIELSGKLCTSHMFYHLFYAPRAPITFWPGRHLLVYGFSHTHCLFPCSTNYAITLLSPKAEFGSGCCKQVGNVLSHAPNCFFFISSDIFCDRVAFLFHATNIFDFSRHVFGTIATLLLFIPPFFLTTVNTY